MPMTKNWMKISKDYIKNILPTMTVQNVENVVKNYMQNFKKMK